MRLRSPPVIDNSGFDGRRRLSEPSARSNSAMGHNQKKLGTTGPNFTLKEECPNFTLQVFPIYSLLPPGKEAGPVVLRKKLKEESTKPSTDRKNVPESKDVFYHQQLLLKKTNE